MKYYLLFTIYIFTACANHPMTPTIDMKAPPYVEEISPKLQNNITQHDGSLFGKGENPLFSDRKAMKLNDILTVVIDESTDLSSSTKKTLKKTNDSSLGAGVFANSSLGSKIPLINGSFTSKSANSFTGQGSSTQSEAFTTNVSARIIKVLSNGNYFIDGTKEILINGDKQIIHVSGVVRPYDIDEKNSISSKFIADAKISYSNEGDSANSVNKPWGTKILDIVWPF